MNMENFKTKDFPLSAFLIAKGFRLLDIENHSKRKTFVFESNPEINRLAQAFYFDKNNSKNLQVDAREFIRAERELKTKLYSTYFDIKTKRD